MKVRSDWLRAYDSGHRASSPLPPAVDDCDVTVRPIGGSISVTVKSLWWYIGCDCQVSMVVDWVTVKAWTFRYELTAAAAAMVRKLFVLMVT